jgi:hypothetical protein
MFQPRFYTSTCGGVAEDYVVADFNFQHRKADGVSCYACGRGARKIGGYDTFAIAFSSQVYDRGAPEVPPESRPSPATGTRGAARRSTA